jgi:hypothetical protein
LDIDNEIMITWTANENVWYDGIYWLLGDCIYPNGNPVITPYKVTDKIRQPSAVKLDDNL